MTPAQTSNPKLDVMESTHSILRRSARRAWSIGQFAAAVKWNGEALELECRIAAIKARKAGVQ